MIGRPKNHGSKVDEHRTSPAHSSNKHHESHGLPTGGLGRLNSMASVSLLHLPIEIHLQIVEGLSPLGKAALKLSCSYFNTLITPHRITEYWGPQGPLDVQKVEKWPIFSSRGLYGCRYCKSLLPAHKFDDDELGWPEWRLCIQCFFERNS